MKVICFGDSNTYGYDPRSILLDRYSPENRWVDILMKETGWNIQNKGMNGQEIPTKPLLFPADTDLLIIMLGTNDLLQGLPTEKISEKMEYFLKTLPLAREKMLLIAPPPLKLGAWVPNHELVDASIRLGALYEALSRRFGIHFADSGQWNLSLAYDGVHLSEEGHRTFAKEIIQYFHISK